MTGYGYALLIAVVAVGIASIVSIAIKKYLWGIYLGAVCVGGILAMRMLSPVLLFDMIAFDSNTGEQTLTQVEGDQWLFTHVHTKKTLQVRRVKVSSQFEYRFKLEASPETRFAVREFSILPAATGLKAVCTGCDEPNSVIAGIGQLDVLWSVRRED